MNKFTVTINGHAYTNAVFPLKYGDYLDEQLDSCAITLTRINVANFKPLTPVFITIESENTANGITYNQRKTLRYVISNDNSRETPVGSGFYRHELSLIEPTKLLEIPIETLCFTNAGASETPPKTPYVKIIQNGIGGAPIVPNPMGIVTPYNFATIELPSVQEFMGLENNPHNPWGEIINRNGEGEITKRFTAADYIEGTDFSSPTDFSSTDRIIMPLTQGVNLIRYEIHYLIEGGSTGIFIGEFCVYATMIGTNAPLIPWSVQDVIERLLDLQKPLLSNGTNDYKSKRRFGFSLFTIPEDKRELFTRRDCPEFTFTRMTLREALKKIGDYLHAEPRLLYNTQTGDFDIISFDFYGDTQFAEYYDVNLKQDRPLNEYNYEDITQSWNAEQGCTELDSYVDNLVNRLNQSAATVGQPFINGQQTLRMENAYLRYEDSSVDSLFLPTQYPVSHVEKLWVYIAGTKYDITPWLYEKTIYDTQLSSFEDYYPISKAYGLYYTLNGKGIRGFFFKRTEVSGGVFSKYAIVNIIKSKTGIEIENSLDTYKGLTFTVEYTPIYSARIKQSKMYTEDWLSYDRALNYAQSDNMIETQYYGENIKGAVARLGTLEKLYTFTCFNVETIPKAGLIWDKDYYISTVTVECMHDKFKVTVGLSKNFNRLSQYIGVPSYKRIYEVSERMVQARDILWQDYIMFTDYQETPVVPAQADCLISQKVLNGVVYALGISVVSDKPTKATAMILQGFSKNKTSLTPIILPCIASAEGNSMTFTAEYQDNYSAGQATATNQDGATYGTEVEYTDYYGRIYYLNWKLCTPDVAATYGSEFPRVDKNVLITEDLMYTGKNYQVVRKDNRESLRMNATVQFVCDTNALVIGSALAQKHAMVGALEANTRLVLLKRNIGKFDSVIQPQNGDIVLDVTSQNGDIPSISKVGEGYVSFKDMMIDVNGANVGDTFKAWAIITEITSQKEAYATEDGEEKTVTINKGGNLLIGRNGDMVVEGDGIYIQGFTAFGVHDVINYIKSKS